MLQILLFRSDQKVIIYTGCSRNNKYKRNHKKKQIGNEEEKLFF